jgi:hypothetical protein
MDVRLSNILNSAERLVRDKGSSGADLSLKKETPFSAKEIQDSAEFANLLTGKYQTIQNKLSELQSQFSREQMRASLLKEEKSKDPNELIHVLFGKEPLFPELQSGAKVNLEELGILSEKRVETLEKEIKEKEVENENVVSLGVYQNPEDWGSTLQEINSLSWKPMNVKNVQKLIE